MDAQLKRGTLDVCVLAALLKEDSYGYKIVKDLGGVMEISESTLYPILKRLEKSGYVKTYSEESNCRLRKFYSITDAGYQKIIDYINDFKELMKVYRFIEKGAKENER